MVASGEMEFCSSSFEYGWNRAQNMYSNATRLCGMSPEKQGEGGGRAGYGILGSR